VRLAFGRRRKMLGTSLAGAGRTGLTLSREGVHEALDRIGVAATARPEELTPAQWVAFARTLGWLADDLEAGEQA
jgi:16S rRNA A1518/A1519 N6-dimethyltransferase RsmA/KsgA/DIM1 with predicted DNA glycosylase/AP lyase activity